MQNRKSIHIAGAGPAGLSASIALAQKGYEVHLHEKYDEVGKRFLGDLQGIENWSNKEDLKTQFQRFGLEINFEATPFHRVLLTDGKKEFEKHSKDPLFYLVKRGTLPESLDNGLYRQALQHGVQVHFRSKDALEKADIMATGPIRSSAVAMDKGLRFRSDLPNTAIAFFHDDLAYLGYSYLLISEGYGCICSVVFKDFHRLNQCFENTLQLAKKIVNIDLEKAQPVGGMGSFLIDSLLQKENRLYAGEAAGIQDMLWGFGIRAAIVSGQLAAASILNDQSYHALARKELQNYVRASIVNRYLWEMIKNKNVPLLPFITKLPGSLMTHFKLIYRFTPFHRLLYPMALRYIKKHYPNTM